MIKVYIAGAMRDHSPIVFLNNLQKGIRAGAELVMAGYAPFCPMLDSQYFLQLREPEEITAKMIMDVSMEWLMQCSAVLVLPGWENSEGTIREINRARIVSIPVFFSFIDLEYHFKGEVTDEK